MVNAIFLALCMRAIISFVSRRSMLLITANSFVLLWERSHISPQVKAFVPCFYFILYIFFLTLWKHGALLKAGVHSKPLTTNLKKWRP